MPVDREPSHYGFTLKKTSMKLDGKLPDDLSLEAQLVARYFHEVLDRGNVDVIEALFHPECVMHRPGGTVRGIDGVRGVAERRKQTFARFETKIHDFIGSGGKVVARLTHNGVGSGNWHSRLGNYDVTGKSVSWEAIAIFRFEDRKIIEEWVTRDELAMALAFGLVKPDGASSRERNGA